MKITGKGQLRHRFWGTYSAVIAVDMGTNEAADAALRYFGPEWSLSENPGRRHVIVWSGDSEALERCKAVLAQYGADPRKVDSIAKSIDYGEPFTVQIEVPHPNQLDLFGV